MPTVKTVLDKGVCGLGEPAKRLYDAVDVLEAVNVAMAVATHVLLPLAELDFHGKWRIQKAIRALAIHDATRADARLAEQVLGDIEV